MQKRKREKECQIKKEIKRDKKREKNKVIS